LIKVAIRVEKKWIVYESCSGEAIDPAYLGITREDIEEYMKEHPMPEDPNYSKKDLIGDLTESSGMLTLLDELKQETREYVAEVIGALV
jgi:hypothetical protein